MPLSLMPMAFGMYKIWEVQMGHGLDFLSKE